MKKLTNFARGLAYAAVLAVTAGIVVTQFWPPDLVPHPHIPQPVGPTDVGHRVEKPVKNYQWYQLA